jgi:hypothetical protein
VTSPVFQPLQSEVVHAGHQPDVLKDLMWLIGAHPQLIGHAQVFRNLRELLSHPVFEEHNIRWGNPRWTHHIESFRRLLSWLARDEKRLRQIPELEPYFRASRTLNDHVIMYHGAKRHPLVAALWNLHEDAASRFGLGQGSAAYWRYVRLRAHMVACYMESRTRANPGREPFLDSIHESEYAPAPIGFAPAGLALRMLSLSHFGTFLDVLPTSDTSPQYLADVHELGPPRDWARFQGSITDSSWKRLLDLVRWLRAMYRFMHSGETLAPARDSTDLEPDTEGQKKDRGSRGVSEHERHTGFIALDPSATIAASPQAGANTGAVGWESGLGHQCLTELELDFGDEEDPQDTTPAAAETVDAADAVDTAEAPKPDPRAQHPLTTAAPRAASKSSRPRNERPPRIRTTTVVTAPHVLARCGGLEALDPLQREEAALSDPAWLERSGLAPAEDVVKVAELVDPKDDAALLSSMRFARLAAEQANTTFTWGIETCRPSEILTLCAAIAQVVQPDASPGVQPRRLGALFVKAALIYGWDPQVTAGIVCTVLEPNSPAALDAVLHIPCSQVQLLVQGSLHQPESLQVVGLAVPALSPTYSTELEAELDTLARPVQANFLLPDAYRLGEDLLEIARRLPGVLPTPGDQTAHTAQASRTAHTFQTAPAAPAHEARSTSSPHL